MRGTLQERFDAKWTPEPFSGCWIWTGAIGGHPRRWYGHMTVYGKTSRAHRISWLLYRGTPIPEKMAVLHHCDSGLCVNPNHLFLGTHLDNMRDMVTKGRSSSRIGTDNTNCKLSEEQVSDIRNRKETSPVVAAIYGINESHVRNIRLRLKWRNL